MRYYRLFFYSAILILTFSCSKEKHYKVTEINGTKIIKNRFFSNYVDKSVFNSRLFVADSMSEAGNAGLDLTGLNKNGSVTADNAGNVFLFPTGKKIYKLSQKDELLKHFSGKGQGPGEHSGEMAKIFMLGDKLVLSDFFHDNFIIFDDNGNFLEKYYNKQPNYITGHITSLNGKYVSETTQYKRVKNNVEVIQHLAFLNNDFSKDSVLYTRINVKEFGASGLFPELMYNSDGKRLYLLEKEEEDYSVVVYNLTGDIDYKFITPFKIENVQSEKNKVLALLPFKDKLLVLYPHAQDENMVNIDFFKEGIYQYSSVVKLPLVSAETDQSKFAVRNNDILVYDPAEGKVYSLTM